MSFGSPQETFESWRSSVVNLELENIVACYAEPAKSGMRDEIAGLSKDGLEEMSRETNDTEFKIEKIIYEGQRAFMRVKRKRSGEEEVEVLTMVLERGAWKLLP